MLRESPDHENSTTSAAKAKSLATVWSWFTQLRHRRSSLVVMLILFCLISVLTGLRICNDYSTPSNEFDWNHRGYSDFHNGTYFPTRAFIDGKSPYAAEVANEYSMSRETPPYSPIVFLLHVPFGLLPLEISRVCFFLFNLALFVILARMTLLFCSQTTNWFDVFAIANFLLISRPGHITMFTGYFTTEIVIGCLIALHFAKRNPWVSSFGMVLASIKPNFFIPLLLLLLCRRNYRAAIKGLVASVLAGGIALAWLSYHNGPLRIIDDIRGGQEALHVDETEMPINTWTRVDLLGMYAKLADWVPDDKVYLGFMVLMMGATALVFAQNSLKYDCGSAIGITGLIAVLTLLLSIYHHSYDCSLLIAPAVSLAFFGRQNFPQISRFWQIVILLLILVPMINYFSTRSAMEILQLEPLGPIWQTVTLLNGLCLAFAWGLAVLLPIMHRSTARID